MIKETKKKWFEEIHANGKQFKCQSSKIKASKA